MNLLPPAGEAMALEGVREPRVLDSRHIQGRGVEIVAMNGVFGEFIRVIVDGSERSTEMRLREPACPHKNLMGRRADQAGSWQATAGLLPP